jgi:DNA-directed RNA polymerase I, II, and III subunit RPABC2
MASSSNVQQKTADIFNAKDFNDIASSYNPEKNKTMNILSKYERTKIIGMRMEQLARSSRPYVNIDPSKTFDPYEVAMTELHERKLPFMICRTLPNGEKEYWRLEDMIIF